MKNNLKTLALWLLLCSFAQAIEIIINASSNDKLNITHIKDNQPFSCKTYKNAYKIIEKIQCVVDKHTKGKIKTIKNNFLTIDSYNVQGHFYISIIPSGLSFLMPQSYNFEKNSTIANAPIKKAKHWVLTVYKETATFLSKNKNYEKGPFAIDFPIQLNRIKTPTINALNEYGEPIFEEDKQLAKDLMDIKKVYEKGLYSEVIRQSDNALKLKKNRLFAPEILLYELKSYQKLEDWAGLLEGCQMFLKEFSSSELASEVLMLCALSSSKQGMIIGSDYFYDRLFEEYPQSRFTALGKINLGDRYFQGGNDFKAKKYYKQALYSAKELDIAAKASEHLAQFFLKKGDAKSAMNYLQKIIQSNPAYIQNNAETFLQTAQKLSIFEENKTAKVILKIIFKKLREGEKTQFYEKVLRFLGIYADMSGEKKEAYKLYKKYLREFTFSQHEQQMQKRLDNLFFNFQDRNSTAQLQRYEELIKTYKNDPIAQKAFIEKVKLLAKTKQYDQILQLKNKINQVQNKTFNAQEFLQNASKQHLKKILKNKRSHKNCKKALEIYDTYKMSQNQEIEKRLLLCADAYKEHEKVLDFAQKYLKTKDLKTRGFYLFYTARAFFALNQNDQALKASDDALAIDEKAYKTLYFERFFAFLDTQNETQMQATTKKLEQFFLTDSQHNVKLLRIFNTLFTCARKNNDILNAKSYAQKLLKLQTRLKVHTYSPEVDFALVKILTQLKEYKTAIATLNRTLKKPLDATQRSRSFYLQANARMSLGQKNQAKIYYKKSTETDPKGIWAEVAKENLELLTP